MESKIDLSIIIVNYNTKQLLKQCLRSIQKSQAESTVKLTFEIIVVDNASGDGSVWMVKHDWPAVKLIETNTNLGFAGGNNQGLKHARGRYVLLLNSDTIILDNALRTMVEYMEANQQVGISGCQLLNNDGCIQPTGGYFPTVLRVFAWMLFLDDLPLIAKLFHSYHPHRQYYRRKRDLDWVTGAFFLIRKEVIEKIGLLDKDYFMYVEEIDYCFRAKKAGFKIGYWPRAKIVHLGGKSLRNSATALIGEYLGLKLFYKKHYPAYQLCLLVFLLKLGAVLRLMLFGVILKSKEARKAYAEAFKSI